jgi:4-amino-4-deoxy-L-arabinose transferase-like glycosyltransferase
MSNGQGQHSRLWRGLLVLIVSIYVVYSSFGIAAPFLWGHNGFHGATYAQRARMTQRFHIVTPATWGGYVKPPIPQSYYLHHPIGYHHLLVPVFMLLGDKEPVVRGVAAAGGVLLILLLYRLVRRWWSEEAAILACAVYVALPILCSFSTLSDPMLLEMSCSLLAVDSFLRYLDKPTRRDLVLGCVALSIGGLLMWEVFFQAFFHGLFVLVYMLTRQGKKALLYRWNAPRMWFLWTFVCTSSVMAFHFLFTWKIGMLPDFLSSYSERHTALFGWVVEQHKRWFSLLYGRAVWAWGVLWLAVFVGRLLLGKARLRDQAVLLFFLINTLYIGLFAKGSAIHLYRVFYYSTFFALAVTDLLDSLYHLLLRLRTPLMLAKLVIAMSVTGYFVTVLPHSYHNLIESREVMGTHGHPGYNAEYEKLLFAKEV